MRERGWHPARMPPRLSPITLAPARLALVPAALAAGIGASAIWNTFSGHAQSGLSPYPSSSHAICSGTTLTVAVTMIQRSRIRLSRNTW